MTNASPPIKAVIDTNIFISGLISRRHIPHTVLEHWRQGAFSLVISADQVEEIRLVLARPEIGVRYGITQAEQQELFKLLGVAATRVRPATKLPLTVRDPKDEMILAAALGGNADYLVTGDADLLVLAGDVRLGALKIISARDFIQLLSQDSDK